MEASEKVAEKRTNAKRKAQEGQKRTRRTPLFPASSFEEALTIPNAIQKHASGQKVRRLTLFNQIQKSPDSGTSRRLITNASKYGLIKGSYVSEYLELTLEGNIASSAEAPEQDKLKARFKLAIENIPVFKKLYESQKGNRLPASTVLEDLAKENEIPEGETKECVEMFIVNAKFLGILKPIAGAERIIPLEQILEELPEPPAKPKLEGTEFQPANKATAPSEKSGDKEEWEKICFYVSPIGDEASEQRNHADLFLGSIVEPALEEFGLNVIRADKIGKPGMITAQIVEYILKSKLVIADLSYHNPNVFYELSLRHACRLPTVQIIRKLDRIPFDLDQFRTIRIDTTSIYSMVPNLQTYKAEIATQVRMALQDPDSVDNPLVTYYPNLRVQF